MPTGHRRVKPDLREGCEALDQACDRQVVRMRGVAFELLQHVDRPARRVATLEIGARATVVIGAFVACGKTLGLAFVEKMQEIELRKHVVWELVAGRSLGRP